MSRFENETPKLLNLHNSALLKSEVLSSVYLTAFQKIKLPSSSWPNSQRSVTSEYYRLLHISKFSIQISSNVYSSKVLENNKSINEFLTNRGLKPEIALPCRILMSSLMVM
jgi:trans-aconitate methyltransferase